VLARTDRAERTVTPLLEARDLSRHFPLRRGLVLAKEIGRVRAVDGVSFTLARGETLAIVGESGCGKSTLGRLLLRLIEPSGGAVHFDGVALTSLDRRGLRAARRRMQMIFQDPFASLNPRLSVRAILAEPLRLHLHLGGAELSRRVVELLGLVGLSAYHAERYPHEFSGGQRQRIGIARALATKPDLIVCDEPVSALDVSIQAHVINLLDDLKRRFALSYIFISHDLAVVRHIADRVAVMYLGEIVEIGDKRAVIGTPRHPYTQALLSAVPRPEVTTRNAREVPRGDVPSPLNPPTGCRFHPRCAFATTQCKEKRPRLATLSDGRAVACHRVDDVPEFALGRSGDASNAVERRLQIIAAARGL
jgi:oligopeptide transport system ATP-binding protein